MGNVISNNIVDGKIRFEGRDASDNGCVMSSNYDLATKNGDTPKHVVSNVQIESGNILLNSTGVKKGREGIDSTSYRLLNKAGALRELKPYLIKKRK